MTKRDFEAIAAAIRIEQEQDMYEDLPMCREAVRDVALQLCITFYRANPRFRQDIFMAACGFGK